MFYNLIKDSKCVWRGTEYNSKNVSGVLQESIDVISFSLITLVSDLQLESEITLKSGPCQISMSI